jgi:hypothetical protein
MSISFITTESQVRHNQSQWFVGGTKLDAWIKSAFCRWLQTENTGIWKEGVRQVSVIQNSA